MKGTSSVVIRCAGCGSSSFTADTDGALICEYCRTQYVPPERVCPDCGAVCEGGARRCSSCGANLVRECLACGALNPLRARKCLACGQQLDVVDATFARISRTTGDHLREVREEARGIKAEEEAASQARLAGMWAAEKRRRDALAQARAERERQERMLFAAAAAIVAFVIVAVIVALVITTGSAPSLVS